MSMLARDTSGEEVMAETVSGKRPGQNSEAQRRGRPGVAARKQESAQSSQQLVMVPLLMR